MCRFSKTQSNAFFSETNNLAIIQIVYQKSILVEDICQLNQILSTYDTISRQKNGWSSWGWAKPPPSSRAASSQCMAQPGEEGAGAICHLS